ncbi:MAG: ARPP-1 family domain-containing protein [bacterium]
MMNIFEQLGFNDIEYGKVQSVDEMTILPILGESRTTILASPENIKFKSTSDYGTMIFENYDNSPGIIPSHVMVISKQHAQDHAMAEVGIIQGQEEKSYENAMCVQQTQGGFLDGSKDDNTYNILPYELRQKLLSISKRQKKSYNKLWDDIQDFLSDIPEINQGLGHLEYFFKPFQNELEEFSAEFEPVENQIGAIILFNDKIVGLEIMPTTHHWDHYWKWIIRGCYGAQLLKLRKTDKISNKSLILPNLDDDIINTLESYFDQLKNQIINSFNASDLKIYENFKEVNGLEQRFFKVGSMGGGDLIYENNKPIYISAII